jgi:hypothetical protein
MAEPVLVAAPGSTLHVTTVPMIAVDSGSVWTAIIVRIGTQALDGATLGLLDARGQSLAAGYRQLRGQALTAFWRDYLDNHEALRATRDRVLDQIDRFWERYLRQAYAAGADGFRIVAETTHLPKRGNRGTPSRMPPRDWVLPRELAAAIAGRFTGTVLVEANSHGGRHLASNGGTGRAGDYYPRELIGPRPAHWGLSEHPRHIRTMSKPLTRWPARRSYTAEHVMAEVSQDQHALLDAGLWRVEQFQRLVNHPDTKAGVVATAAGLLLAGLAGNTGALRVTFASTAGGHRLAQALLVLTAGGLVAVLVSLGAVLLPRMRSEAPNVFAPGCAPSSTPLDVDTLVAQSWAQGAVLAEMATAKVAAVRWALLGTGVAAVGFALWSGVVACL